MFTHGDLNETPEPVHAGGCVSISLLEKKATIEAGVEPPSGRDRQQNLDVDRFLKAINTF